MNIDELDLWNGIVDISDKVYDDDEPAAYLPESYRSILADGGISRLPVTNPDNGITSALPLRYTDDEEQKRLRLSAGALATLGATPGQVAQVDFTPSREPSDYLELRSMSYGPRIHPNETHRDANYGPFGNKLEDFDVAVSPDVEAEAFPMGSIIEDSQGNLLRVADRSYFSPGQPTSGTVERRDVPDLGKERYRLLTPDEIQQRIAEMPSSALIAGQPTAAAIQALAPPTEEERKNATVDPDGWVNYNNKMNLRANPKLGIVTYDIGEKTFVTQDIGGGKFTTTAIDNKQKDKPAPPIPKGATVDQAMSQLSEADKLTAREIAEGRAPMYSKLGRQAPDYARLREYVHLLNPHVQPANYLAKMQAELQYKSQKATDPGGMISSYNQGLHHLGTIISKLDNLPITAFKGANELNKAFSKQFGGKAFAEYDLSTFVLSNELARAFKRAAPDQGDIKEWNKKLESVQTPEALKGLIRETIPELLGGALETLDNGYTKATGERLAPDMILDKSSRNVLKSLGVNEFIGRDTETGMPVGEATTERQTGRKVPPEQDVYSQAIRILQSPVASPELKEKAQKALTSMRRRGLLDDSLNFATGVTP